MFSAIILKPLRLVLASGLFACGFAQASEPPAAASTQTVVEKVAACAACHGPNGVSQNPMYPSLAGQYRDYLEVTLKAYKSGVRKNPIMGKPSGFATQLSDQDIKAIAAYFAAQPGKLYTPALK